MDPNVDLSSKTAGAAVNAEDLSAAPTAAIRGGTDIDVTLPHFGIGSDIDIDDVVIYSDQYDGNPSERQRQWLQGNPHCAQRHAPWKRPAERYHRNPNITGDYIIRFSRTAAGHDQPRLLRG